MLFFFAWLFFVLGTSVVALPFPSPGELGQVKRGISESPLCGCWTPKGNPKLSLVLACFSKAGELIKTHDMDYLLALYAGEMLLYERAPATTIKRLLPDWNPPIPIDEQVDTIELRMSKGSLDVMIPNVLCSKFGPRTYGFWAPQQIHRQIPLVVHIHQGNTATYFHNVDFSEVFNEKVTFVRVLSDVLLHTVFKVPAHLTVASTSIEEDHRNDELQITMVPGNELKFELKPLNYPAFT